MQREGFAVSWEPHNIFYGKVPVPTLTRYMELHSAKDVIIPNLLAHNFSSDGNANKSVSVEAIFDVKTLQVNKNANFYRTLPD